MKFYCSRHRFSIILANVISLIFLGLIVFSDQPWKPMLIFFPLLAILYILWYKIWPAQTNLEKNILKLEEVREEEN